MVRTFLFVTLMILLTSACGGQEDLPVLPSATPVPPTRTPSPSPTPRQMALTPTSTPDVVPTTSGSLSATEVPEDLPDFSGVTLYEVTHLMDPRWFQVSMDGWPADVPEDLIVRVGTELFTCEILFPDQFPHRVYCWGFAPPKGTEVTIQVIMEKVAQPLLEIPFRVPYPSDEGS